MNGRIDVHSHLLPGVDDGCKTIEESLACARILASAGYSHCFCTPHIWPSYANSVESIPDQVARLQTHLDSENVALRLIPGGEINLRAEHVSAPREQIVTYAMSGQFVLIDMWHDRIPDFVAPAIRNLQSFGLKVILAHPERMRAVQEDGSVVDFFTDLGVLLQGNLQCFSDAPHAHTRQTAERLLLDDRYFVLGSDLHGLETLPPRLAGLERARELVGDDALDRLTITNPRTLLLR